MDKSADILLDSGAMDFNFINKKFLSSLPSSTYSIKTVNITGTMGSTNYSWTSNSSVSLQIDFQLQTIDMEDRTIPVEALVMDDLFCDIIIGRPTIVAHNLFQILEATMRKSYASLSIPHTDSSIFSKNADIDTMEISREAFPLSDSGHGTLNIHGSESLKANTHKLVQQYDIIFQSTVGKQPINCPPMTLKLLPNANLPNPVTNWYRRYPKEHIVEINRQVEQLLELGVIERCDASFCSNILLVKKPDKSLRFCVDYRALNKVTEGLQWPLPHIGSLIQDLGGYKYYGVIDLTSGYHQCELSSEASQLTAFRTPLGVYRFKRVPFGLKGAPSYFQRVMVEYVLRDLTTTICRVYIDDIIVFGHTAEEFIRNLRTVFSRLKAYNVRIKREKCRLGLTEVTRIASDRGSEFVNSLIQEFMQCINVPHHLSIAYNHQDNGMVERQIREVRRHLRTILLERNDEVQWSEQLPTVQRIINSTTNSETGFKPADLRFGKFNAVDGYLFKSNKGHDTQDSWLKEMTEVQNTLLQQGITKQTRTHQQKQKQSQSGQSTKLVLLPDQFVLVEEVSRTKSNPQETRRRGPYQIIKVEGRKVFLRDPTKTAVLEVHISRCTPYINREGSDPLIESVKDTGMDIIEVIQSHRTDGRRMHKSGANVFVLVKWRGYPDPDWQPLSNRTIRRNQAFLDYAQLHPELQPYVLLP